MARKKPLTYRSAGVDIDAGDALVDDIKSIVKATSRPEVIGGIGGFGALTRVPSKYTRPVLVSGTDGVGTKLKLAIQARRYQGLGVDLVAMCVNDILVAGAEPLFFLDYFATGKLDRKVAASVIKGVAEGCRQAGCALVGGETAEMPGMYARGDFDLAGFSVGVVEEAAIITGKSIRAGDVLVALPSSGPHSNGYSLIRKVLSRSRARPSRRFQRRTLGATLLEPTRIYVRSVLEILQRFNVRGMAHITGGGLPGNLPRVMPKGLVASIDSSSWRVPPIFEWLQDAGGIDDREMRRAFNCGVGFVLVLRRRDVGSVLSELERLGESPWVLGEVEPGAGDRLVYR